VEQTETEIFEEIQHIFLKANSFTARDAHRAENLQRLVIVLLEYVKDLPT
jgi:hypothetical protein